MKTSRLILLFMFLSLQGFAQDKDTTNLLNRDFVDTIYNPIELEKAERMYFMSNEKPDVPETGKQTYDPKEFPIQLRDIKTRMRIPKLPTDPITELNNNYVRLGFGNYFSPYFEGYLFNKRSKTKNMGLHVLHESSLNGAVDNQNSGFSTNQIDGFSQFLWKKYTLKSSAGFTMDKSNTYGYSEGLSVNTDTLERRYNRFRFLLEGNSNNPRSSFYNDFDLGFNYTGMNLNQSEWLIGLNTNNSLQLQNNIKAGIGLDANFGGFTDPSGSEFRNLIKGIPYVKKSANKWKLKIGASLNLSSDTLYDKTFSVFPVIRGDYAVDESKLRVYAGLDGGMNWVTLDSISRVNQALAEDILLYNSVDLVRFYAGLSGELVDKLTYNAELSLRNVENLGVFQNDSANQEEFNYIYDEGKTAITQFKLGARYRINDKGSIAASGLFSNYQSGLLESTYHLPTLKTTLNFRYFVARKIRLNADFYYISGIEAKNFNTGNVDKLGDIVDLNLYGDYLLSDKLSMFLSVNNLLNNNYQRFLNYPVQGLKITGGITFAF